MSSQFKVELNDVKRQGDRKKRNRDGRENMKKIED